MEQELQLRDVIDILRRRLKFILLFVVSCMAAATLFLIVAKPEYTAVASLKYNPAQFDIAKEKKNVNSDLFDRLISGEVASVTSPSVLLKAIRSEKLLDDRELNKTTLRDLFSGVLETFQLYSSPEVSKELWILERFKKRLKVDHLDRTNIISISYRSEDPEKSARVSNAVSNIFLAHHLEDQLSSMPLAAKWLSERKETLRDKWRKSQSQVEQFKAENKLNYLGGEKLREQQIDRLNEQLILASTRTEAARARVEKVRQLLKSRNYQQLADIERSNVLTRLRDRFAEASQRQASTSAALLPNHPTLGKVNAEVASLRRQIENEGKRILDNLEVTFQAAQERERLLREKFDESISGMEDAGANIVKLRELKRTADTDREIYEAFLNRSNETLEQSAGQFANFRLVQIAQVPSKPSFPSKFKVLLLAAFGSVAAAVGIAFIRETLAGSSGEMSLPRQLYNLPVLARLPKISRPDALLSGKWKRSSLLSRNTAYAASLKALSREILDRRGESVVIAFTSVREGEGKTSLASDLARIAAKAGNRTLLVDTDWENPGLHRAFGLKETAQASNGEKVVFTDPETGVDLVPAIADAANATGFARCREFKSMLKNARSHYDLVLLDSPAMTAESDVFAVTDLADEILFVVDWNATPNDQILRSLSSLEMGRTNVMGVILNRIDGNQFGQANDGRVFDDGLLPTIPNARPSRRRPRYGDDAGDAVPAE